VAAAMAERAADGLTFILTVGDNILPDGVKSADDPQWKTKFEDVYADPALQVPVYASLGNHDHGGNARAQIEYSDVSDRWRMPAAYYTFTRNLRDGTRIQFFAIDSEPIRDGKRAAAAQLAWLDEELGKSEARWKIVFGHHPLCSYGKYGHNKQMIGQLEPLFTRHKVDVYFAGHDHNLQILKPIKGVHYVVSGGAGGPDKAYAVDWTDECHYAATLGGFAFVRASKDELVIEFVRLDSTTQYAHIISK
jgi:acid phosphatase